MMTNIIKNKITINNIIEFVHKAMHSNKCVKSICYNSDIIKWVFTVNDLDFTKNIEFEIVQTDNKLYIYGDRGKATLEVTIHLTERDIIDLNVLHLDIKEYRENKALELFNNFFSNESEIPTNIDDLDNDDE